VQLARTNHCSDPELFLFRPGLSAEEFFARIFDGPVDGDRTVAHAAWRLVRYHASLVGLCTDGQTLIEATRFDPDPWTSPCQRIVGSPLQKLRGTMRDLPQLPLLPPDVPEGTNGKYSPESDRALNEWRFWMARLASQLRIDDYFLQPELVRVLFPSPETIVAYEELLLDELLEIWTIRGAGRALTHCRTKLDLSTREAVSFMRGLGPLAGGRTERDSESTRALMVIRLDGLYSKAMARFDFRGAHSVLKTLAVVQGLAAQEVFKDRDKDREETIREVEAMRDRIRSSHVPRITVQAEEA